MKDGYTEVQVTGFPGRIDFKGDLIMTVPRADGVHMAIIGAEWEGREEIIPVPMQYVTQVTTT